MSRMLLKRGGLVGGLCLLVLAASPALAKEGRQQDSAKHLDGLDKKLELTDQQRGQVEQVLTNYHNRVQSLQGQLESLRKEKHEKIKALLTPEQQAKFEKMHKRKGHGWGHWMKRKE